VGRGLFRANARSSRLIGVRRGRISYIAVASSYLRLAGLSSKPRKRS
jgi:hypothetical protein